MKSDLRDDSRHLPRPPSGLPLAGLRTRDLTMVWAGPAGTLKSHCVSVRPAEVQRAQRLCRGLRGCPPEIHLFRVLLCTRKRTHRHPHRCNRATRQAVVR
jgi:hypothetical protein